MAREDVTARLDDAPHRTPRTEAPTDPKPWVPLQMLPPAARADVYWAVVVVLGGAAVFVLLSQVRAVAVPVLVALALAYALDPVVDRLQGRGWSRTTAILVLGAAIFGALGTALALVLPQLVRQAAKMPEYLQEVGGRAIPLAERLVGRELPHSFKDLADSASSSASELATQVGPAIGQFALKAAGGTAATVGLIFGLALVPLFLFYFLRDFDEMKDAAAQLIPPRYRGQIVERFREIDELLAAFVRGQLTLALILATLYSLGLTISGVKLGLVIGVAAGMLSIVPVAGVATGVVLSAVAVIVDWHEGSEVIALGAAITFVVGQILEGSVITPKVVGEKVGLSAVVVLLAVLAFGEIFGFVGMLLAVPMTAVLKVVLRVLLQRLQESALFRAQV